MSDCPCHGVRPYCNFCLDYFESKAAECDKLRPEVKRLERELVEMTEVYNYEHDARIHWKAEAERLKAEHTHFEKTARDVIREFQDDYHRLRGALEQVISNIGVPQPGYPAPIAEAYRIALAALHSHSGSLPEKQSSETEVKRAALGEGGK